MNRIKKDLGIEFQIEKNREKDKEGWRQLNKKDRVEDKLHNEKESWERGKRKVRD